MLDEGRRRRERGRDVVVGFVECHGRPRTEGLIDGLEVVPPLVVELPGLDVRRRWTSTRCCSVSPRWPWWTSWPTPTCPGRGDTRSGGRTSSSSWMPTSTSSPPSTSSTSRASPTPSSGSSRCRSASGCPTGCCARPTRSNWWTPRPSSCGAGWSTATSTRPSRCPEALAHYFRTDNLTALRELALRFLADETEEQLLGVPAHTAEGRGLGDQRAHPGRGHHGPRHGRHRAAGLADGHPDQGRPAGAPRHGPTTGRTPSRTTGSSASASWPRTSVPIGTRCGATTLPRP